MDVVPFISFSVIYLYLGASCYVCVSVSERLERRRGDSLVLDTESQPDLALNNTMSVLYLHSCHCVCMCRISAMCVCCKNGVFVVLVTATSTTSC